MEKRGLQKYYKRKTGEKKEKSRKKAGREQENGKKTIKRI